MSVLSHIFPLLREVTFLMFWKLYGLMLHTNYVRNPYLRNICVFPYFSRTTGIHFSHVLEIVWMFLLHTKYLRNSWFLNVCVFPYFSRTKRIYFLVTVWIFAWRKICTKPLLLECPVFPYFFLTIRIHFPRVLETILDAKTNKKFLFPIPFSLNHLCETLH